MTKRIIASSCSAALFAATLAAAQETRPAPPQPPIALTGCVTEQTSAAVATSGNSEAKHEGLNLLLTKASAATRPVDASAVPGSRPSGSGSGTIAATPDSRTRSTGAGEPAGMTYALAGSQASQLARYVGQRLEVVGTIDPESLPKPPPPESGRNVTATGGRTEPTTTATAHPSAPPRFIVTSFRPVAGVCR